MMKPTKIIIHCSATKPSQYWVGVNSIRESHLARGFSDIGYHFVINRDGHWCKGRPISKQGAGVFGHNKGAIHICMVGGLDESGKPEDNFTERMYATLRYRLSDLCAVHGIKEENISGHRDYSPDSDGDGVIDESEWIKVCPCFDVSQKLQEWK